MLTLLAQRRQLQAQGVLQVLEGASPGTSPLAATSLLMVRARVGAATPHAADLLATVRRSRL